MKKGIAVNEGTNLREALSEKNIVDYVSNADGHHLTNINFCATVQTQVLSELIDFQLDFVFNQTSPNSKVSKNV